MSQVATEPQAAQDEVLDTLVETVNQGTVEKAAGTVKSWPAIPKEQLQRGDLAVFTQDILDDYRRSLAFLAKGFQNHPKVKAKNEIQLIAWTQVLAILYLARKRGMK